MENSLIITEKPYVSKLLPTRPKNSNKGTYGTVLNLSGSSYYSGAAFLSSISSLKVGAGLVRLASTEEVIRRVCALCADITFINLGESDFGTIPKDGLKYLKNIKAPSAISIGCGLTTFQPAREFTLKFLKEYENSSIPIVIDADALNILAQEKRKPIPLNSVMTPHPMELSRLLKVDVNTIQEDRLKWAKEASSIFDCIVVLKGYETIISIPGGNTFVNKTGNSALSHAGSGDVLCGMIAGFAAQGVKLEDACVLACYLHGRAGELASIKLTEYSATASDIVRYIPEAIKGII